MRCQLHGIPLICFCPACRGAVKSKRKAKASKLNGKLGGRPMIEAKRGGSQGGHKVFRGH